MVHQVTRFYEHSLGRELTEEEKDALQQFYEALEHYFIHLRAQEYGTGGPPRFHPVQMALIPTG